MFARAGGIPRGPSFRRARQKDVKRQGGPRGPALEGFHSHGRGSEQDQGSALAFPRRSPERLDLAALSRLEFACKDCARCTGYAGK